MWGRRFRLPSPYVPTQTITALASGYLGTGFSICYLAVGGVNAEEPIYPKVGRRKRLPHSYSRAVVRSSRSRDGQGCFRAGLVAGYESGEGVANAILHGETGRQFYQLRAWVIMPNHVHVLLQPHMPMPVITRWLKGSTARRANLILSRTGEAFWQDESFDHRVRNDFELDRIVRYVEHNPVNAGLANTPGDWAWSSARLAGGSACPT